MKNNETNDGSVIEQMKPSSLKKVTHPELTKKHLY